MSTPYLLYKSHEPALVAAFSRSVYRPEVEPITHSDMITTGGTMYIARIKISFTLKKGNYTKFFMYIPGSSVEEQHHLNDDDREAVAVWLNTVHMNDASRVKNTPEQGTQDKI